MNFNKSFQGKFIKPYKFWEFEISRDNKCWNFFDLFITLNGSGCDHAGFRFNLEIIGLSLNFKVYDSRHWDYENNCWENYDNNK